MKPKILGKNLIHLTTIDSTNNYATKLVNQTNIPNGTVILAEHQTNGRGQRENSWESEPHQNLTFSIIYFPQNLLVDHQYALNKAVAIGIMFFCNHLTSSTKESTIKWPNDILINKKKVCGILIENALSDKFIKSSVIGIGLNINQKIFTENIKGTSISKELKKDFDLNECLNWLLLYLEQQLNLLSEGMYKKIDDAYRAGLFGLGEWRKYEFQNKVITAQITGISEYGELELITANNTPLKCGLKEIAFIID